MSYTTGVDLHAKNHYTTGNDFSFSNQLVSPIKLVVGVPGQAVTPINLRVLVPTKTTKAIKLQVASRVARQVRLRVGIPGVSTRSITLHVAQAFRETAPITVKVQVARRVVKPIALNVSELKKLVNKIHLNVYTFGLLEAPIRIEVVAIGKTLVCPLRLAVHTPGQAQRAIKLVTTALPLGSITEQGVGHKLLPALNKTRKWTASIVVGGVDVTHKVIEDVKVSIEANAARVASFSFLLNLGTIDLNAYAAKPVVITYREHNPITGDLTLESVMFNGIVDTPSFDINNGVLTLNCTDAIQKEVMSLPVGRIVELTPEAYWSPYVYQEYNNRWEYLLQTIETYPYMFYMDSNRTLTVVEEHVGKIKYQFERSTIIDGTLTVALASSRDITNYVDVGFTYVKDEFREQVIPLNWVGNANIPQSSACSVSMIVDAASSVGGAFVGNPSFAIQPKTRTVQGAGVSAVVVNLGDELIAVGCNVKLAKRYTQNVSNTFKTVVKCPSSIEDTGILSSSDQVTLTTEYLPDATKWFTETTSKTQYWCTANNGTNLGADKPEQVSARPYRPSSTGGQNYEPYPIQAVEFPVWATDKGLSPLDIKTRSKRLQEPNGSVEGEEINSFSVANYSAPYAIGEHVYDLDHVVIHGTNAEAEIAYKTLIAKAKTAILRSHRQNVVTFNSSIKPFINLGDTLRVSTPRLLATGVTTKIDHTLSIRQGSAVSTLTLKCSTSKPFKAYNEAPTAQQLVKPIVLAVGTDLASTIPSSPGNTRKMPAYMNASSQPVVHYDNYYGNHYYTPLEAVQPGWLGHVCPKTGNPGDNEFRVHFPEIPFGQVNSWTTTINAGTIDVQVFEDEFLLRSI